MRKSTIFSLFTIFISSIVGILYARSLGFGLGPGGMSPRMGLGADSVIAIFPRMSLTLTIVLIGVFAELGFR